MSVGVIGVGYVGLPLAVAFAESGRDVVAVDIDPLKVAALTAGESYIEDVSSDRLAAIKGRITATGDFAALADVQAVLICVPTPLTANREPDLGPLISSTTELAKVLRSGQLVVLESTTYPGTTRDQLTPLLEESGLVAGSDFHVAFSPERIDPGRSDFTLKNTPKIVGGLTSACLGRALDLYGEVCDSLVPVSGPEAAELAKLLENIFRSVNIALVNELAVLCDRMKIDVWEVVEAAATKPYGFMPFSPGPGLGGHCLPVDPFYLAWKAREYGTPTEFIELAGEVNQAMPHFCVDKISLALNENQCAVSGSKIAVIGVAYKPGVGDMRESPAIRIMDLLRERGAELVYHDTYIPELDIYGMRSQSLDDAIDGAEATVIVTAHPDLDVARLVKESKLVVDFRGVTRTHDAPHVTRL